MNRHYLLLGIILLTAAGLRFWGMTAKSIWLDEAFSWRLSTMPIPMLAERSGERPTTHPPLSYVLFKAWSFVAGDSDMGLRALAAIFGLGAILGTFFCIRDLASLPWPGSNSSAEELPSVAITGQAGSGKHHAERDVYRLGTSCGLLAAALVALSVLQIHASQQIRMYSMGACWAAWSGWLLVKALAAEERAGFFWVAYTALAIAFCYTHYMAVFFIGGQGIFVATYMLRCRRPAAWLMRQLNWAVMAGIMIAAAYVPWLPNVLSQARLSDGPRFHWLSWDNVANQIAIALIGTFDSRFSISAPAAWSVVTLLVVSMAYLAWSAGPTGWYLFATGFIGAVLLVASATTTTQRVIYSRSFTFVQLSWLSGLAVLVFQMPGRPERYLLCTTLLAASLWLCSESWDVIGCAANPGMRGAVEYILNNRDQSEPIVAKTVYVVLGADFYAHHAAKVHLFGEVAHRGFFKHSSHVLDEEILTPQALFATDARGVWFISSTSYEPSAVFNYQMPDNWRLVDVKEFEQDYKIERPLKVEHYKRQ